MAAKKKIKIIKVAIGDRVNYVMKDGQIRPFDIVRVWNDQGYVNGILSIDGVNDDGNIPGSDGPVPQSTQSSAPLVTVPHTHIWVTSVNHDENKTPGTWHFAETEIEEEDEEEPNPAQKQPPAQTPGTTAASATTEAPTGNAAKTS